MVLGHEYSYNVLRNLYYALINLYQATKAEVVMTAWKSEGPCRKEKMLVISIFSFTHKVFKRLFPQGY